jgi:hypothetical protein
MQQSVSQGIFRAHVVQRGVAHTKFRRPVGQVDSVLSERAFRTAMGFVMPQWTDVKFLKARADTGARKTYFETFDTRGRAPEEDR